MSRKTKLFIERTVGERVFVGEGDDQVEIVLARVKDKGATLHFFAAPHVKIDRAERKK